MSLPCMEFCSSISNNQPVTEFKNITSYFYNSQIKSPGQNGTRTSFVCFVSISKFGRQITPVSTGESLLRKREEIIGKLL